MLIGRVKGGIAGMGLRAEGKERVNRFRLAGAAKATPTPV